RRGGAELPRPRRLAAERQLGADAQRQPQLPQPGLVDRRLPGNRDLRRRAPVEPRGRCTEVEVRPAPEAGAHMSALAKVDPGAAPLLEVRDMRVVYGGSV